MKSLIVCTFLITVSFAQTYVFKNKNFYFEQIETNIYLNENGKKVRVKENFFVKLKKDVDVDQIVTKYELNILKKYTQYLYLVNTENNCTNILGIIEQIDKDEDVIYAYPNFSKTLEMR